MPVKILIVDDDPIFRHGLKDILAGHFRDAVFAEADEAQRALEEVWQTNWDAVVLDINLPGRSGLDILREIKKARPALPVLVLSMHPEEQYAVRILKAGASGYITKVKAPEQLAEAIKKLLAGGKFVSAAIAESLITTLNMPVTSVPHEVLSDREYQIMRLIAVGKTVKEIGFDLSLSVKTVSTYRTRVLKKLDFKTNADVIRYAMRERLVD